MTGVDHIAASNGWAMAAVGWSIVLTGLAVLSVTISQLHKILKLWDDRKIILAKLKNRSSKRNNPEMLAAQFSEDIHEVIRQLKLLTNWLGDPFSLPRLIELSEKRGLIKPQSTINKLLALKIIVPDGEGYFTWA